MRRKRVDGTEGGGGRGGHREVMAVVVAEERGGGFYKKSGRAAPFVDATDGGRRRAGRTGVARRAGAGGGGGWRGRADDLGDDTTKNQMHGHWLFSIRIIGFPGRRSSDSPRPSRYSLSLLRSLLLRFARLSLPRSLLLSLRRRRRRCCCCRRRRLLRRASLAAAVAPLLGGMGAGEKGRKNFEKKSNFVAMVTGVR